MADIENNTILIKLSSDQICWYDKLRTLYTQEELDLKPPSLTYQEYYNLLKKYSTSTVIDILKYIYYG